MTAKFGLPGDDDEPMRGDNPVTDSTRAKKKVEWCGRDDWHGQHGWVNVDNDDQPIGEWAICPGFIPHRGGVQLHWREKQEAEPT